jgi:large subunit ribosomal protein L29
MKANEIRAMSIDAIQTAIQEAEKALFKSRFQVYTRSSDNTALIRQTRREIARLKTVLTQKQREEIIAGTHRHVS